MKFRSTTVLIAILFCLIGVTGCTNSTSGISTPAPTPQIVYVTVYVTPDQAAVQQQAHNQDGKHAVELCIKNTYFNPIIDATVSITDISTSVHPNEQTLTTDTLGCVVFEMSGTEKYNVKVSYQGKTQEYSIFPQDRIYSFVFNS